MRRARKVQLDRLFGPKRLAELAAAQRRCSLEANLIIADVVRDALAAGGIDPSVATALQDAERWAAQLARLPPVPDDALVSSATDSETSGVAERVAARIRGLAERYPADRRVDFATIPLFDLLAWCVARGYLEPQPTRENLLLIPCRNSKAEAPETIQS